MNKAQIFVGDNRKRLRELPDGVVQCVVTSPPYWGLRDYGQDDQIGLESTPTEFVEQLCLVFDEVWRVLADDGTLWLNLGDSYYNKSLAGIPWRVAFALQERGWYLRQDIIWAKPNPMPESVTDRCTKSHEYIFLLTKKAKYFFDHEAIKEEGVIPAGTKAAKGSEERQNQFGVNARPAEYKIYDGMRNKRDVWTVPTKPYPEAHFATYPPELIIPCILAGSKPGDLILDPFSGSGTTGAVALQLGRNYVGYELNPEYAALSEKRIYDAVGMLGQVEIV